MNRLFEISNRLKREVTTSHYRYLYNQIAWFDRLIMIRGARGVGKTTMMRQQAALQGQKSLYASLDQLWFNDHTIIDLADYHYKHGGTHLYLDEVHRYPRHNWEQELKNIFDSYPDYHIVFTGSSLLELNSKVADLSRRVAVYDLRGLSFREYLEFRGLATFAPTTLSEMLDNHMEIASDVCSRIKVIKEFENYLQKGFYPFFLESSDLTYAQRVERTVRSVIELDIPAVMDIEYATQLKLKKLLVIVADQVPFTPNTTTLSRDIGVSRNQLLKLLELLSDGAILRSLRNSSTQPKSASRPEKVLFDNPSIMLALGSSTKIGTLRESFAASMLSASGELFSSPDGDFLLNKKYTFEVGGHKKGFAQIADTPDSYVLADDIESGFGNKIPLWMVGFLY